MIHLTFCYHPFVFLVLLCFLDTCQFLWAWSLLHLIVYKWDPKARERVRISWYLLKVLRKNTVGPIRCIHSWIYFKLYSLIVLEEMTEPVRCSGFSIVLVIVLVFWKDNIKGYLHYICVINFCLQFIGFTYFDVNLNKVWLAEFNLERLCARFICCF